MYRYLIKKNPKILLYLITSPLRAISSVACAGALAAAIDYANGGQISQIGKYILVFSAYILADLLIDAADQAVRLKVAEQTMTALKADIYHKLSHMYCDKFFSHNTADYLSNMTTDAETLRSNYFTVILDIYADFLRCGVAIAVLIWVSPILGLFVLATSLVQTLVPILYAKKLEKAGENHSNAQEQHMTSLKENLSAFLTAKAFHIEDKLEQNYRRALENAEERRFKVRFLKEWSSSLSYVFNQIAHLGVFLMGAILVIHGTITVADIVAASELIVYISYPILWLNGELAELRTANVAIKKLNAILTAPEDNGGPEAPPRPEGEMVLRDLRFAYGEREILCGIDYDFERGRKYLIVGSSGSGKSTLLNLLAGLRQDYTGSIALGGIELRRISRKSLTESLCAINQDPFLFDDTLYNNVCLYEQIDEAEVLNALRRVGLQGLLETLPEGIHTHLGENASTMSGGERQRVAIARALVRKTPILLLDESTSHLDPQTASEIERLVLELEGVTVLLVSHNATNSARTGFDAVLELKDGKLRQAEM